MGGHEGDEEEEGHEARHEGCSSSKGYEGHEEEEGHESHEGCSSSKGYEGHEEEEGHEGHEGRSSAQEGHEGYEVNIESGFCLGCGDVHAFECCRHSFS